MRKFILETLGLLVISLFSKEIFFLQLWGKDKNKFDGKWETCFFKFLLGL